jgi:hypothetical protein
LVVEVWSTGISNIKLTTGDGCFSLRFDQILVHSLALSLFGRKGDKKQATSGKKAVKGRSDSQRSGTEAISKVAIS